ncbi:933_t:CDS:2 [Funneliformis caledonium]|uniref:933_t:CDS:1 n=1 Tax=Funneliformis caledonium TaxID=1117310 RepID=A0A9N9HI34_9GLOM|nr:933_t:CDS:2 [Funneliformis caledonium]
METFKEKLQLLKLLLPDAREQNLSVALRLSNGEVERALNIYLEQRERHDKSSNHSKQSKLDSFIKEKQADKKDIEKNDDNTPSKKRKIEDLTDKTVNKDNLSSKKLLNLQEVLRWSPNTSESAVEKRIRTQTLRLYRPEDISVRTPCTLIQNVLPKKLANSLLRIMLKESDTFTRNQGFLFGQLSTTPHTSQYYVSNEMKIGSSNGRHFPPEMEQAKFIIMNIINEKRKERKIYEYEVQGDWNPNIAAANCYSGSKVTRQFRLRRIGNDSLNITNQSSPSTIYSIPLIHNSLIIMWPPCQELWKHEVCPQNSIDKHPIAGSKRINITFRQFRDEYGNEMTPICNHGELCMLKPVFNGRNVGRYFYTCNAGGPEGKCDFFEWLNIDKKKKDFEERLRMLENTKNSEK